MPDASRFRMNIQFGSYSRVSQAKIVVQRQANNSYNLFVISEESHYLAYPHGLSSSDGVI